jgi:hypothetical protein
LTPVRALGDMRKIQREISLAVVVLLASAAVASAGQQPPAARAGEQVVVTQAASGEELRGRLVELSSTSLAILVDGRRVEVPIENVLRIDVRNDSLKNGAIIGGAIMGGLMGLACVEIDDAAACATGLVIDTGLGVLAGIGIDALHKGRTPIYIKAGKSETSLQVKIRF